MAAEKILLTNNELCEHLTILSSKLKEQGISKGIAFGKGEFMALYGIPNGGAIVVSHLCMLYPEYFIITSLQYCHSIVDDLKVSGQTIERVYGKWLGCNSRFNEVGTEFLIPEKSMTHGEYKNKWIVFPWELNEKYSDFDSSVIRQLEWIGEDPTRAGLKDTPKRVEKMYDQIFSGYRMDEQKVLSKTFPQEINNDQMITCTHITFYSMCEHHMVPFFGQVHIGYVPSHEAEIVGLSKLVRLVEVFSKRLQIQERLTGQIMQALQEHLKTQGVIVVIKAEHLCMKLRGVKNQTSVMTTSAISGVFKNITPRQEFFNLIN